jgi:hypothetical protein
MKKRATRVALAGLAVLMAAALAACGSDTPDPQPSPTPPAAAPTSTPTPTQPTSRPATGPATRAATATPGSDFGFIHSWTAKAGTFSLRFDRAVLLTGKAADAASAAHGGESPAPNDYYIQNDNPRLREVVIGDQARVIGSQQLTGSPGPNPSSLKALLTFVHNGGPSSRPPPSTSPTTTTASSPGSASSTSPEPRAPGGEETATVAVSSPHSAALGRWAVVASCHGGSGSHGCGERACIRAAGGGGRPAGAVPARLSRQRPHLAAPGPA